MEMKNIGIKVKESQGEMKLDKKSLFSGPVKLRGRTFTGTVISDSMQKTVTVQWHRLKFLKKFERYEKRKSKVKAHNPEHLNAKKGDIVKIVECRPLSKTKNFVVVEVLGKEKGFAQRMEALSESKVIKEKDKTAETEE